LRQVAVVARDCGQVADQLREAFGWAPPFHDPGVGQFGLTNAVFTVGDTFLEVVAPARPDTTAGRYLFPGRRHHPLRVMRGRAARQHQALSRPGCPT
jgi:hypothetical protein